MARTYDLVIAQIPIGESDDSRPGVIIAVQIDDLLVLGGTAHESLWRPEDFIVRDDDPQFIETQLDRATAFKPQLVNICYGAVVKRLGVFQGRLATRFARWFGDE